jgi:PHP family Zn ribbon phosphoesterase
VRRRRPVVVAVEDFEPESGAVFRMRCHCGYESSVDERRHGYEEPCPDCGSSMVATGEPRRRTTFSDVREVRSARRAAS